MLNFFLHPILQDPRFACVVLALSVLLATLLPARRAANIEPVEALRAE